jgi:transposase
MRYELSDYEWTAVKPMLPNKPCGVRRVNDRRVLSGIFWVLRSGASWRDLPETYERRLGELTPRDTQRGKSQLSCLIRLRPTNCCAAFRAGAGHSEE